MNEQQQCDLCGDRPQRPHRRARGRGVGKDGRMKRPNEAVWAVIKDMAEIIADPVATEPEALAALDTLLEAVRVAERLAEAER